LSFLARRNAGFPPDRKRIETIDEFPPGRKKTLLLEIDDDELRPVDIVVDFGEEDWLELNGAGLRSSYPGRKKEEVILFC
jgi:hypothetical protein